MIACVCMLYVWCVAEYERDVAYIQAARVVNNPGKVVDTFVEAVDKDLQVWLLPPVHSIH